ncbi:MAG: Crp/Fnr family transcriptional regulator [Deltaproteobacteria bacterium]
MSELASFFSKMCRPRQRDIDAGCTVFRQGDPAGDIFLVTDGRIRLVRYTADGDVLTMFRALPGDTFAEAALFAENYHCTAVADIASRVTCFPRAQLLQGLASEPAAMLDLIALLSGQVRELRTLLEIRSIHKAPARIMLYLRLHADPATGVFSHAESLKDLALELGLAHETLYRTLTNLEKEGEIARTGRSILVRRQNFNGGRL